MSKKRSIANPKVLLRVVSCCAIILYLWLLAANQTLVFTGFDLFRYPMDYTKARRFRDSLIMVYDLCSKAAYVMTPLAILSPVFILPSSIIRFFNTTFSILRLLRGRFHNHRHWSYQHNPERHNFPYYDAKYSSVDDWAQVGMLAAGALIMLHMLCQPSVLGFFFQCKKVAETKFRNSNTCQLQKLDNSFIASSRLVRPNDILF